MRTALNAEQFSPKRVSLAGRFRLRKPEMGSMTDKASGLARTRRSMTKRVERHPEKQRPKSKTEQERELSRNWKCPFQRATRHL